MNSLTPNAAYSFMMCQRIGRPPISSIGFGRVPDSSAMRVPLPPARMTHFIGLGRSVVDTCEICASENLNMSSPAACDRYQSAVHASDSPMPRLGRQPSARSASPEDRVRACASGGCTAASRSQPGFPAEARTERIDHFVNPAKGCRIGPEIDSARRGIGRQHQRLREREVSPERLEHVLPGPDRIRIAQPDRLARLRARGHSRGSDGRRTNRRRR